jgi:hypothetical protein
MRCDPLGHTSTRIEPHGIETNNKPHLETIGMRILKNQAFSRYPDCCNHVLRGLLPHLSACGEMSMTPAANQAIYPHHESNGPAGQDCAGVLRPVRRSEPKCEKCEGALKVFR